VAECEERGEMGWGQAWLVGLSPCVRIDVSSTENPNQLS
jgi:hypothetical protein